MDKRDFGKENKLFYKSKVFWISFISCFLFIYTSFYLLSLNFYFRYWLYVLLGGIISFDLFSFLSVPVLLIFLFSFIFAYLLEHSFFEGFRLPFVVLGLFSPFFYFSIIKSGDYLLYMINFFIFLILFVLLSSLISIFFRKIFSINVSSSVEDLRSFNILDFNFIKNNRNLSFFIILLPLFGYIFYQIILTINHGPHIDYSYLDYSLFIIVAIITFFLMPVFYTFEDFCIKYLIYSFLFSLFFSLFSGIFLPFVLFFYFSLFLLFLPLGVVIYFLGFLFRPLLRKTSKINNYQSK